MRFYRADTPALHLHDLPSKSGAHSLAPYARTHLHRTHTCPGRRCRGVQVGVPRMQVPGSAGECRARSVEEVGAYVPVPPGNVCVDRRRSARNEYIFCIALSECTLAPPGTARQGRCARSAGEPSAVEARG
jgi:hypothetical protein